MVSIRRCDCLCVRRYHLHSHGSYENGDDTYCSIYNLQVVSRSAHPKYHLSSHLYRVIHDRKKGRTST